MAFYLALILLGVFFLSLVIVTQVMTPEIASELPDEARMVLDSDIAQGGGRRGGRWIVGLVCAAAIGSGVAGLAYRLLHLGYSRERISAKRTAGKQARRRWGLPLTVPISAAIKDENGGLAEDSAADQSFDDARPSSLPTVPRGHPLDDSPGERLRYRLASISSGRWSLFGTAALALIWNCLCFVLLAVAVTGWWFGSPRPVLAMLLIPFALAAFWTLRVFLRQVRPLAGVGSTLVEINEHPLTPGGRYEVFVSQMGRMRLRRLTIELICEEESFFRQGTDVRADRHVALSQELLTEKLVSVDPQAPWQQQFSFELPANAMHSFCASNNTIRWRLIVSGESRPWPSFCRSFPVIVHPPLMAPPDNPR